MSKLLLLILCCLVFISPVFADRTIVTPSGYTMQTGNDFESFQAVTGRPRSLTLIDSSTSTVQVEFASLERPTVDCLATSIQAMVLPETFESPAVSIGIKDVANTAGKFAANGFYGRAYYIAASKSLSNSFLEGTNRGVLATAGLGGGSYHGFFGALSASLPLNLVAATEFDSRSLNYKVSLHTSSSSKLSFDRIGGANWISFDLHSNVSL